MREKKDKEKKLYEKFETMFGEIFKGKNIFSSNNFKEGHFYEDGKKKKN